MVLLAHSWVKTPWQTTRASIYSRASRPPAPLGPRAPAWNRSVPVNWWVAEAVSLEGMGRFLVARPLDFVVLK